MTALLSGQTYQRWRDILVLAILYFATAKLGHSLALPPGYVSPVWIPSGIILAAVLRRGYWIWPGIFLGAFAGNVSAYLDTSSLQSLSNALMAGTANGVGHVLSAVLGAYLIQRTTHTTRPYKTAAQGFALILFGVVAGTFLSALFGVTGLCATGFIPWSHYGATFATWWTGDAVGVLVITPFLLSLERHSLSRWILPEAWLFAVVLGITALHGLMLPEHVAGHIALVSLTPLVMWSLFRLTPSITFASVVFIAAAAITAFLIGHGHFIGADANANLIELQLFIAIQVISTLILQSVVLEHRATEQRLRLARDQLDATVMARTKELKTKNEALQVSEARLRALIDHLDSGVVVHAPDTSILLTNDRAETLLGLSEAQMAGRLAIDPYWRFVDRQMQTLPVESYPVSRILATRQPLENMLLGVVRPDRETTTWMLANGSPLSDARGELIEIIISFFDITHIKESEQRLDHLAHHDALTGLPNRLLFNARLQQSIERAERCSGSLALVFVDLDRFKHINDSQGHPAGDELLRQVAHRLAKAVRQEDTVARISGDEFMVLLEGVGPTEHARVAVEQLIEVFKTPLPVRGHPILMTASMGICIYPQDGQEVDELMRNADIAMYRAKEDGRNGYQFFSAELTKVAIEHAVIDTALKGALEREEFALVYQPQFDLADRKLSGVEALLRWRNPELGDISPARFVPIAEQHGMILEIGRWVLLTACRQARAWHDAGLDFGRIAVNISGNQIRGAGFAETVHEVLIEADCEPRWIELEITESFVMRRLEHSVVQLNRIRELGVQIAIDDFGTGYSSLSYLKQLPIDKLKIDQSFVHDIPEDPNDMAIIASIIALGHALGQIIIAEGVETEAQAEFLKTKHCDQVQGFLYGRPVSATEIAPLLLPFAASDKTQHPIEA